ISGRELNDPFLWPKIWKENPGIKNPDLIYPDQTVKIPLYLLQKEVKEEPLPEPVAEKAPEPAIEEAKAEEPAPVAIKPLVEKNVYLASGFVGEVPSFDGTIDGHASGRIIFGNKDIVYVKMKGTVAVGDRFYIYHKGQNVIHPVTQARMGYVMEPVGILEVKKFEYGETVAEILQSFSEVLIGDLLIQYYEMQPPVVEQPFRNPDIDGYVVATRQLKIMSGNNDIVYIDRGEKDGLKPGDLINTVAVVGKHKVPNGQLQVISTRENTAAAIILKMQDRLILPGNFLTKAE
ncbi:MAG: LysM peptidoglycan-binding domain-containing protein, partial [Nitrospirota bacterium]|nr:LysM peptidoglycan-binding domain-containing protein [Nitrospirota bacterium]